MCPNITPPNGLAMNPVANIPKVARSDIDAELEGKNSVEITGASEPSSEKSYHSRMVPANMPAIVMLLFFFFFIITDAALLHLRLPNTDDEKNHKYPNQFVRTALCQNPAAAMPKTLQLFPAATVRRAH